MVGGGVAADLHSDDEETPALHGNHDGSHDAAKAIDILSGLPALRKSRRVRSPYRIGKFKRLAKDFVKSANFNQKDTHIFIFCPYFQWKRKIFKSKFVSFYKICQAPKLYPSQRVSPINFN